MPSRAKRPNDLPMRLAGVISITAERREDGGVEYRVIDGQHRIGALEILAVKGAWDGEPRAAFLRLPSRA